MGDFSTELEPLFDDIDFIEPLARDVLTADGGGIEPPAKRQCTNSMKAAVYKLHVVNALLGR